MITDQPRIGCGWGVVRGCGHTANTAKAAAPFLPVCARPLSCVIVSPPPSLRNKAGQPMPSATFGADQFTFKSGGMSFDSSCDNRSFHARSSLYPISFTTSGFPGGGGGEAGRLTNDMGRAASFERTRSQSRAPAKFNSSDPVLLQRSK